MTDLPTGKSLLASHRPNHWRGLPKRDPPALPRNSEWHWYGSGLVQQPNLLLQRFVQRLCIVQIDSLNFPLGLQEVYTGNSIHEEKWTSESVRAMKWSIIGREFPEEILMRLFALRKDSHTSSKGRTSGDTMIRLTRYLGLIRDFQLQSAFIYLSFYMWIPIFAIIRRLL